MQRVRKLAAWLCAIAAYMLVHEGAHLITALCLGVFKSIHVLGVAGVQVDVYAERLNDMQMGIFCLIGPLATLAVGWSFTALRGKLCKAHSRLLRAVFYNITVVMLVLDGVYISVLSSLVGGGDLNGIVLLMPEPVARILFGVLALLGVWAAVKKVVPVYKATVWNE